MGRSKNLTGPKPSRAWRRERGLQLVWKEPRNTVKSRSPAGRDANAAPKNLAPDRSSIHSSDTERSRLYTNPHKIFPKLASISMRCSVSISSPLRFLFIAILGFSSGLCRNLGFSFAYLIVVLRRFYYKSRSCCLSFGAKFGNILGRFFDCY